MGVPLDAEDDDEDDNKDDDEQDENNEQYCPPRQIVRASAATARTGTGVASAWRRLNNTNTMSMKATTRCAITTHKTVL